MLDKLLPLTILEKIKNFDEITEIRLRLNKNVAIYSMGKLSHLDYVCTNEDILSVLRVATKNSKYSCENTIINGYLTYYGARIGLSGEGVIDNNKIITLKNIKSLCIRLPHEIKNINPVFNQIINDFDNTIILSKPGLGKTTLLRELIRRISNKNYNVLVLDERGEISFENNTNELGNNTDVILNIPKSNSYSTFVRVLRPDVIATDEIFGEEEVLAIEDTIRCGVKVIATLHTNSISNVNQRIYAKLLSYMRYIVILKDIGVIDKIIDRGKHDFFNNI